jgi:hypothetical protein
MNTFAFFNEHLGRLLVPQDGEPHEAAYRALSSEHVLERGIRKSRLLDGCWAIVRPTRTSLKTRLTVPQLHYDDRTWADAFADELSAWDGKEPRIFICFKKRLLPAHNLFLSVDLRVVRVCSPQGVETFDATQAPGDGAGRMQRAIWKRMGTPA